MSDTALARYLTDRLGYGPRPGDLERIAKMGADPWIDQQLRPGTLSLPQEVAQRLDQLSTLKMSAGETYLKYGPPALRGVKDPEERKSIQQQGRVVAAEAIEARILRAVYSPAQLEKSLVDFWFNHFNVFVGKGLDREWVGAYERDAIRPHVLGRFRDLLGATAKHPAMLFYLDNWENTAPGSPGARGNFKGLNENYARELMELHTLGVDGGYSQADVITLAKILTGWGFGGGAPAAQKRPAVFGNRFRVDGRIQEGQLRRQAPQTGRRGGAFAFADDRHDFSPKTFLGHKITGKGEVEGEQALDILAHHPATAKRISYKLAQYFISDDPPAMAVEAGATTFTQTGGDIAAVLKTLFTLDAFRDSANFGARFKTPLHYVISSLRASGAEVRNFRPAFGLLQQLGQPLYGCLTPDGYKCTEAAWLNPDGMTRRITYALALAAGKLPLSEIPADQPRGVPGLKTGAPRVPRDPARGQGNDPPVDANALIATLGGISDKTKTIVAGATPELRAALVFGSPDFMRC